MNKRYLGLLAAVLLVVFFSIYSAGKSAATFRGSVNELLLRKIGHRLLLSSGDDTSRVMPIKELGKNQFRIIFENALSIEPDSVIRIVDEIVKESSFPGEYFLDIIDCKTTEQVYGFMRSLSNKKDIIACQGRTLPTACYFVDIRFTDTVAEKKNNWLIAGAAAALLLLISFYFARKKKPVNEEEIIKEENFIRIGQYRFFSDQHSLEFNNEKIILTNKESKLLLLFANSINQVIDRNVLQKEVWENEGVIVTRSLDMFVSKLRKKLQQDPAIKIVNIPGKGYKLEVTS